MQNVEKTKPPKECIREASSNDTSTWRSKRNIFCQAEMKQLLSPASITSASPGQIGFYPYLHLHESLYKLFGCPKLV